MKRETYKREEGEEGIVKRPWRFEEESGEEEKKIGGVEEKDVTTISKPFIFFPSALRCFIWFGKRNQMASGKRCRFCPPTRKKEYKNIFKPYPLSNKSSNLYTRQ